MTGGCNLKRENSPTERGSVMLEFGFVVTGLFLGALVFIDTSRMIHQYLILTHVASEGTRLLSRTPSLLEGEHVDEDQSAILVTACNSPVTSPGQACGHLTVQRKVRFLLTQVPKDINLTESHITSNFSSTATTGEPEQSVFIEIQSKLDSFILPDISISASHVGSYLIR